MKKLVRISIVSIVLSFSMIVNSFAVPYNFNQYTSVTEESDLLPPGVKQSKATESAVARGDFFIRADLTIKNNGDGTIGALAVALTRFPVDEAYITIYLDRWDEESERWRQVKYHEEEFYAEEGTKRRLLSLKRFLLCSVQGQFRRLQPSHRWHLIRLI